MNWPFSQCRYAFILLVWNRHIVLFKHVCCTHTMTEQASACVDTFTSMFTVTYRRIVCHQHTCPCASPLIRLCVHIKVSTVHAFILLVGSKQDPLLSSSLPRCIWHDSFWCFKTEGPWNGFTVGRESARGRRREKGWDSWRRETKGAAGWTKRQKKRWKSGVDKTWQREGWSERASAMCARRRREHAAVRSCQMSWILVRVRVKTDKTRRGHNQGLKTALSRLIPDSNSIRAFDTKQSLYQ